MYRLYLHPNEDYYNKDSILKRVYVPDIPSAIKINFIDYSSIKRYYKDVNKNR